jgi:hypothetical protein
MSDYQIESHSATSSKGLSTRAHVLIVLNPYCILSTVCRQLYDETCLLPYALNTFSPITLKRMDAWLSIRLPVQCNAIVSFKVAESMVEDYWFDRTILLAVCFQISDDCMSTYGRYRDVTPNHSPHVPIRN